MEYLVKAKSIIFEKNSVENGRFIIKEGKFDLSDNNSAKNEIDLSEYTVIPGLIDIHVHGGNGFDIMDCEENSVEEISKFKIKEGVTSFCPTTVTSTLEKTVAAIEVVKKVMEKGVTGANIIGTFLEGPYINTKFKGAHPETLIRDVNISEIKNLIEKGKGTIKSFAIAPELIGATEAIEYLANNGVNVRLGHTSATYKEAVAGFEKGANIGIHTYNAMSQLGSREAGMVGAIMLTNKVYAELISDMVHVEKEAIQILVKQKGYDKVVLVTDCMMAGGLSDGEYKLGELTVSVNNNIARTDTGALAGSTLRLMTAVKNMTQKVGLPIFEAVQMATAAPAKAVGIFNKKGSISQNKDADFVAIDDDFNVVFVMVGGVVKLDNRQ